MIDGEDADTLTTCPRGRRERYLRVPLGADDTDPFPMPDIATDSPTFRAAGGANVAVTEFGWPMNTVHVAVVPLGPHAPPHPPNVLPPTAEALNVTSVRAAKVAEHCP